MNSQLPSPDFVAQWKSATLPQRLAIIAILNGTTLPTWAWMAIDNIANGKANRHKQQAIRDMLGLRATTFSDLYVMLADMEDAYRHASEPARLEAAQAFELAR